MLGKSPLYVVGRFPPPLDGQAIATERLASLLNTPTGGPFEVTPVDVGAPEGHHVLAASRFRMDRAAHFLRSRRRVAEALSAFPSAPVLWTSVSPSLLGHLRDLLVVSTGFQPHQRVYAVVHRGDFVRLFTSSLTRQTGRSLVQRLAGVVFLSSALANQCAPWIPHEKRLVVPNTLGTNVVADSEEATSRTGPADTIRLLFLSNMIPSKGYADVLEAVHTLRMRGHDAQAAFVGRWPSADARASFERRIQELDLSTAVDVLGGVSDRSRVRQLYLESDLFVLPTTYPVEAQPLTVLEALAAGTPVIVTRHASLPEMVENGQGAAFVRPHQPDDIADAALELVAEWQSQSRAARARYDAAFSLEVVRKRWVDMLAP